jgi:nitrogen regulatory protein PII
MRSQRIFSKMKRIEIVVASDQVDSLVKLIELHSTGYTLVPGVTGLGEHGFRDKDMVLLVTVVTAEHLDAIVEAILPSLNQRANIVLISEVAVLRAEHFIPEVRAARHHNHA